MRNAPALIHHDPRIVRSVTMNGVTKFAAIDICNILGYPKANKILGRYCNSTPEYIRMRTAGGPQYVRVIERADIEAILNHSKRPAAPALRQWLDRENARQRRGLHRFWSRLRQLITNGRV